MRSLRSTAIVLAALTIQTHWLYAQTSARGSTIVTKVIVGTGPDPAVGFTGIGTSCSNYNTNFYSASTNTLIACVNTNPLSITGTGTYTIVNSGGTSGLASSGANTIPFVVAGGNTQPATAANIVSLFGAGNCNGYLKNDGTCANITGSGSIPSITSLLKGDGSGGVLAATATSVTNLFSGAGAYLRVDGTTGTPVTLPNTSTILKGNNSGGALAATASDVTTLFSGAGAYLKADGTTGTPSASLPTTTALLKGDGAGGAAAATATSVTSLFSGAGAYLRADGTTGTPGGSGVTLPSTTALLKGDGTGGALAATVNNITGMFSGGGAYLKADGTTGTPAGASLPSTTSVLKGDGSGGAAAATSANIGALFTGGGAYLKADGTTGTPTGSVSIPSTSALLQGDGSGGVQAATGAAAVTSLFSGGGQYLKADGTTGTPSGTSSGIPTYTTAGLPATGTTGQLAFVTDNTSGLPFYSYDLSGNAFKLLDVGTTGGLTMTTQGQIDINTSVVPRLAMTNNFSGSNTFGQAGTTTTIAGNLIISGAAIGSRPTCASALRGQYFFVQAASGSADGVQVCAKDAANAYSWKVIF